MNRQWFETQLRTHFSRTTDDDDDDSAWYAIRNTIYASGCRIELSRTKSFREATQTSWRYFENAMSVHTNLIYFKTSLISVQAVLLMVRKYQLKDLQQC